MNKNTIALIVLIIVLLGAGYFASKSTQQPIVENILSSTEKKQDSVPEPVFSIDKVEWSTFTNENYNYTIQFPKEAKLVTSNAYGGVTFKFASAFIGKYPVRMGDPGDGIDRFYMTIWSMPAESGLTLDQWVENELGKKQAPTPDIAQKKIILDGEEAYYLEYSPQGSFKVDPYNYVAIYTIHKGIKYRIAGLKVGKESDFAIEFAKQSSQMFDVMIKSFKFID